MASSQKPFYLVLGGIVVVGVGALVYTKTKSASNVSIPANVIVTASDTAGFHGYTLGSPTAPIEVVEYGDLECPICSVFATVQFPDVKARLIDTGRIFWRYRDFPLDGPHKHPRVTAHAAACADEQGKYWPAQAALFQRQNDYASADNPMPPLAEIMKSVGVNTDAWTTCMKSAKFKGRIQASENEANQLGASGTPTFLIQGHLYSNMSSDQFVHLIDSLSKLLPAAAAKAPAGT